MRVLLSIEKYWPEGLSLETAEAEMKEMGIPLNRRSLGLIRRSGTDRGDYATPYKLAAYLSKKLKRKVTAADLMVVED